MFVSIPGMYINVVMDDPFESICVTDYGATLLIGPIDPENIDLIHSLLVERSIPFRWSNDGKNIFDKE